MALKQNQDYPVWGFFYHYPDYAKAGGEFQLDVYLTEEPIGLDFNPKTMTLTVALELGGVEEITLFPPLGDRKKYKVVAGKIEIHSHEDLRECALTFGGEMTIEKHDDYILCKLVSPAPIYEITRIIESHQLLVDEIEIVLAERKAFWGENEEEYAKRLAAADPLELYLAISRTLTEKFKAKAYAREEAYRRLAKFLQDEILRMRKMRRGKLPEQPLEKIL